MVFSSNNKVASNSLMTRLLLTTVIAGISSGAAYAQTPVTPPATADAASADEPKATEIVVTGSRIARRDFKSESPISTVTTAAIAAAGQPSLDRVLGQMPQFEAGQGASEVGGKQGDVGFGGGASYSNLRGIGRNRSLVLMDGRRLMPSTPDGSIDLNTIPMSMIESVEVITGGASATYGSDAVAGVANFKLKNHFSGLEINVDHGASTHGDGATTQVSGIFGGSLDGGKGHMMLAFEYGNRQAVEGSARPFFTQSAVRFLNRQPEGAIFSGGWGNGSTNPSVATLNGILAGYSGTSPVTSVGDIGVNTDGTIFTSRAGTNCAQNYKGVGTVTGAVIANGGGAPGCSQAGVVLGNYFAVQVPLTKYNVFAKADYELDDHITAYAQFNFSESSALDITSPGSTKQSYSSPIELAIPISNPFVQSNAALLALVNSAYGGTAPATAIIKESKLMYGWGNRVEKFKYDVWQGLVGLKGDIPGTSLTYDVYASYGRSNYTSIATGDISISAINKVLAAEGTGGCTYNPFGLQPVSAACLAYAGRTNNTTNAMSSKNVEATVQGPLFHMPAGDVKFALGADYRSASYDYQPATQFVTGDSLAYSTDSPSSGTQSSKEVFGELLVPLLKDESFAKDLSLDLGYRYSKYDTFAGKSTWKADLSWEPTDGVLFRGGYSVAIRAPSLADLKAGQSIVTTALGGVDPCTFNSSFRTGANAAAVTSICSSQSAAAGSTTFSGANTVPVQSGGNSLLQPENAKTWTIGTVLSPVHGLHVSVDYYNINISGAIFSLSQGDIVNGCYGAIGNPAFSNTNAFCQRITRDTSSGNILLLTSGLFNFSNIKLDGIDAQADYQFDLGGNAGQLQLGTVVSYLRNYSVAGALSTTPSSYAGTVNASLQTADKESLYSHPNWKANSTLTYSNEGFSTSLHWRYIGGMTSYDDGPTVKVPAYSYFDIDAHYKINDRFTLSVGVNNLADKGPPFISRDANGAPTAGALDLRTDAATYDVIGRTWHASIKAKF